MAGGVALNCVANGKILKSKIFENIWIQPAAGDAGGALGAAMTAWYKCNNHRNIEKKSLDKMNGSFIGQIIHIMKSKNLLLIKFL